MGLHIQTNNLKTLNNQSLIGEGNLESINFSNTDLILNTKRTHSGSGGVEFATPFTINNEFIYIKNIALPSNNLVTHTLGLDDNEKMIKLETDYYEIEDTGISIELTSNELNEAYPNAMLGFQLVCPNIGENGVIYKKTSLVEGNKFRWAKIIINGII